MAVATFKHKLLFVTNAHQAYLRLPAEYDVIQIQFHLSATPHASDDRLLIEGFDEDGDAVILPGGGNADGAHQFADDKVLQFTWKGPALRFTYTEATAGLNAVVKVKTFGEGVGDADTFSAYPTGLPAVAAAAPGVSNSRTLVGR